MRVRGCLLWGVTENVWRMSGTSVPQHLEFRSIFGLVDDGVASAEGMNQSCRLSGPRQGFRQSLKISCFQVPIVRFQKSSIRNPGIFQHLGPPVSCALSCRNLCGQVGFSLLPHPRPRIPRACPTLRLCSEGAARGNILAAPTRASLGRSTLSTRGTPNPETAAAQWAPLGPSS